MRVAPDGRIDDGSAQWAEDCASGFVALAMYRNKTDRGPAEAAQFLTEMATFCMTTLYETPELKAVRYETKGLSR